MTYEGSQECPSRQQLEDLLYFEAQLLDEWRLSEWLDLLSDDAEYEIPATGPRDGDCSQSLALVYDDRERITARVKQYLDDVVYAEKPRSRLRRIVGNVRLVAWQDSVATVHSNLVVYRFASERMDTFVGRYECSIIRTTAGFRIKKRRIVLDIESLRLQCMLSIIL